MHVKLGPTTGNARWDCGSIRVCIRIICYSDITKLTYRKGWEGGIWTWDCVHQERVLVIPSVVALLGDNPMQSEFACHVGSMGKYFCRVCRVKGSDVQTEGPIIASQQPEDLDAQDSETSLESVEKSVTSLESELSSVESSLVSSIESSLVSSVEPDKSDQESGLSSNGDDRNEEGEEYGDDEGEVYGDEEGEAYGDEDDEECGDEGGNEDSDNGKGSDDSEGGDAALENGKQNNDQRPHITATLPSSKTGRKKKLETMEEMVDRAERFLKASFCFNSHLHGLMTISDTGWCNS